MLCYELPDIICGFSVATLMVEWKELVGDKNGPLKRGSQGEHSRLLNLDRVGSQKSMNGVSETQGKSAQRLNV